MIDPLVAEGSPRGGNGSGHCATDASLGHSWLAILHLLGSFFLVGYEVDRGFPRMAEALRDENVRAYVEAIPKLSLSSAFIGIPFGFMIYQLYYWAYWRGTLRLRLEPEDKGFCVLCGLNLGHYLQRVYGRKPVAVRAEGYHLRARLNALWRSRNSRALLDLFPVLRTGRHGEGLRTNWYLAEALWYDFACREPFLRFKEQVAQLTDVYHSVGIARVSLLMAALVYLGYVTLSQHIVWLPVNVETGGFHPSLWSLLWNSVLVFLIFTVLSAARRYVLHGFLSNMRNALLANFPWATLEDAKPASATCRNCHLGHWQTEDAGNLPTPSHL